MRSIASHSEFAFPVASPKNVTLMALSFVGAVMVAAALVPTVKSVTATEPRFACATIDWRVNEKLMALQGSTDTRAQAIANTMTQQRNTAAAHCAAGRIDDAMTLYGLTDRALTRYVSYGTAATLP